MNWDKIVGFINNFSVLVSAAIFMTGWITGKVLPCIKRYHLRRCLSLKKKECKIVLPEYNQVVHDNNIIPVCPIGDLQAASNIIDLIYETGLYPHQQSIFFESAYNKELGDYNLFLIGGLLANKYTFDIFKQFFPEFKILAAEEKIKTNPNKIPAEYFRISAKTGFGWKFNGGEHSFEVETDERYAVVVKLSGNDFKAKNHGTIHVLFGNGVEGTLAISNYLLHNYEDLTRRAKNKEHYFIAFKLKRQTGLIDTNSIVDLADQMFGS